MSTHFYPRPLPPSSPLRPLTAHSTIRAVTPSPPHSAPRPKSEHTLGSNELATFARYVTKAEEGGFSNTPGIIENGGGGLRRGGGIRSGRTSPVKSRSASPRKSRPNSPQKSRTENVGMQAPMEEAKQMNAGSRIGNAATPSHDTEDEYDEEPPLTPTPMTREQRRHAYTPLSVHRHSMARKPVAKSLTMEGPASGIDNVGSERTAVDNSNTIIPPIPPITTTNPIPTHNTSTAHSTTATSIGPPHNTNTARPTAASSDPIATLDRDRISLITHPTTRLSTSFSASSKHSIFSTPGRDELERKKALIEEDEGPFGRVKSMGDLVGERERVGSAGKSGGERRGKLRGRIEGLKGKMGRGCGVGCVVM